VRSPEVLYIHQDHLQSTNVLTDESGGRVEETVYYPFGAIRKQNCPQEKTVNGYSFSQKELDGESDLYYFSARYYNGILGRFITPDMYYLDNPSQAAAFPQRWNPYAYCRNSPLVLSDPTGQKEEKKSLLRAVKETSVNALKSAGYNVTGTMSEAVGFDRGVDWSADGLYEISKKKKDERVNIGFSYGVKMPGGKIDPSKTDMNYEVGFGPGSAGFEIGEKEGKPTMSVKVGAGPSVGVKTPEVGAKVGTGVGAELKVGPSSEDYSIGTLETTAKIGGEVSAERVGDVGLEGKVRLTVHRLLIGWKSKETGKTPLEEINPRYGPRGQYQQVLETVDEPFED
jgi:RHS repeat-associated protein